MAITALGYLGVRSDNFDDWTDFACTLLGMQRVDRAGKTLAFRMDDYKQRLVLSDEPGDALAFVGWEVENQSDLDDYASRLEAIEVEVERGSSSLADRRFVQELIVFNDPDGNRVELFWNPHRATEPFVPGRTISGFKTGPLGMGHAVLHVRDIDRLLPFYRDTLGFGVSDFGLKPIPLYFLHVNGRHHSFAMVGSKRRGLHHFMVEFNHLDDVGQGYDLAQLHPERIAYTLGRHTNDFMTSFYVTSPSGFFVENGWGGRVIDPTSWTPHETFDGPSLWGHERLSMPEDQRNQMRAMRLAVAERGIQAPAMIDCPWLFDRVASTRRTDG